MCSRPEMLFVEILVEISAVADAHHKNEQDPLLYLVSNSIVARCDSVDIATSHATDPLATLRKWFCC